MWSRSNSEQLSIAYRCSRDSRVEVDSRDSRVHRLIYFQISVS